MCSECHDVLVMSMKFNITALSNIDSVDYRCIINGISKREAVDLLQNVDLSKKNKSLQNKKLWQWNYMDVFLEWRWWII